MGGSSSDSGGSSNLDSLRSRDRAMDAATNRAKAEQEAKSRSVAFDQGGTRGREHPYLSPCVFGFIYIKFFLMNCLFT